MHLITSAMARSQTLATIRMLLVNCAEHDTPVDVNRLTYGLYQITVGNHDSNTFIQLSIYSDYINMTSCDRIYNGKNYDLYNRTGYRVTRHGYSKAIKYLDNLANH